MPTLIQSTTGGQKPGTLEEELRLQEENLENARQKSKASSDGLALLKKAIAETQQLADAYGRAFDGYGTNFRELKSLREQQAKLFKGLSEQSTKVDEEAKMYDNSVEENRKRVEGLEKEISAATAESANLVQARDGAAQELDELKTRQKKIDQNLKSVKAIREDVAAKEIKGEYVQVQFILKRYKELIDETEKLLITKDEFESKLRAAWLNLYEANKTIQDSQAKMGIRQAELKKAKENLKQLQEDRDKTILARVKGPHA